MCKGPDIDENLLCFSICKHFSVDDRWSWGLQMAELKSGEMGRRLTTMPLSENLDLSKTKRSHGKMLSRKKHQQICFLKSSSVWEGKERKSFGKKKRKRERNWSVLQNHFGINVVFTFQVNGELSNWDQHSPHPKEDTLGPSGMHSKGGAVSVSSEVTMISSKLGPSKYPPSEQPGEVLHVSAMEHQITLNMTSSMDETQAHMGKRTSKIKITEWKNIHSSQTGKLHSAG